MPERKGSISNRVFGAILGLCVVVMILGGIAWARGWENGVFLVLFAGGFANIPMFHFAMNWPLRDSEESEREDE